MPSLQLWLLVCFTLAKGQVGNVPVHRKFEYKHSFKGPNLAGKDGLVSFWEITGDAMAGTDQIRLAPSIRSKQGMAWNTKPLVETEFFDIEMSFKVTGQGRIGADGLAMWYTANKGSLGPVFGSNDYWTGLGVFFDSFDNDAQRNNPYITVMLNDGTKSFDHHTDGTNQKLAGCQKDFRNKPYPIAVKIEYNKNVLTVLVSDGMTEQERFELCVRAENVFLPRSGYFGLSAATGGLADDHDVVRFLTYSLNPYVVAQPPAIRPEAIKESQKQMENYESQQKEFEEQRKKFAQEHPDKVKKDEMDMAKMYEDAAARELRLIFEGQNAIHTSVAQIASNVQQLIGSEHQQTALISQIAQNVGSGHVAQAGQQQQQQGGAGAIGTGFQRHEVTEVMQLTRELHGWIRDLRSYVTDTHSKVSGVEQKLSQGIGQVQPLGGAGSAGGADQFQFQTVKGYLEGMKHDIEQIRTAQRNQLACPVVETSCVSSTLFFIVIVAQTVLMMMYWLLKGSNEKAKFY